MLPPDVPIYWNDLHPQNRILEIALSFPLTSNSTQPTLVWGPSVDHNHFVYELPMTICPLLHCSFYLSI